MNIIKALVNENEVLQCDVRHALDDLCEIEKKNQCNACLCLNWASTYDVEKGKK